MVSKFMVSQPQIWQKLLFLSFFKLRSKVTIVHVQMANTLLPAQYLVYSFLKAHTCTKSAKSNPKSPKSFNNKGNIQG